MMKKIFLLIAPVVFCLQAPASAQTQTLTFSTYYPAPFGSYDRLRLVPRLAALLPPCDPTTEGLMYYDSTDNELKVCAGNPLGWSIASVWTKQGNNIYPTDTLSNSNLRVGIGTTTPGSRLSVSGGISAGTYFANAAPANGMIVSGNVGIGTTAPTSALHVVAAGATPAAQVVNNQNAANAHGLLVNISRTSPNTDAYAFNVQSGAVSRFLVRADGNVGIGTAAPASRLSVNGGISAGTYSANAAPANGMIVSGAVGIGTSSPNVNSLVTINTAAATAALYWATNNQLRGFLGVNGLDALIGAIAGSGGGLRLRTNNLDRMTITNAGNVGIGTTTPGENLEIEVADATDPAMTFDSDGNEFTVGIDSSDSDKFKVSDSTALGTNDRVVVDSTGKVSIPGQLEVGLPPPGGNNVVVNNGRATYSNPVIGAAEAPGTLVTKQYVNSLKLDCVQQLSAPFAGGSGIQTVFCPANYTRIACDSFISKDTDGDAGIEGVKIAFSGDQNYSYAGGESCSASVPPGPVGDLISQIAEWKIRAICCRIIAQ